MPPIVQEDSAPEPPSVNVERQALAFYMSARILTLNSGNAPVPEQIGAAVPCLRYAAAPARSLPLSASIAVLQLLLPMEDLFRLSPLATDGVWPRKTWQWLHLARLRHFWSGNLIDNFGGNPGRLWCGR